MNIEIIFECLKQGIFDRDLMVKRTGLSRKQVQGALTNLHRKNRIEISHTLTVRGNVFYVYKINETYKRHIFDRVNSIFNVGAV